MLDDLGKDWKIIKLGIKYVEGGEVPEVSWQLCLSLLSLGESGCALFPIPTFNSFITHARNIN